MRLGILAVLLSLLVAGPVQAAGLVGTQARIERAMSLAGPDAGALVVDLATGRRIYAREADVPRIPASVNKLFVTASALLRWGPEGRLATDVLAGAEVDLEGVLAGDLHLRGGGDPTFAKAQVRQIAAELAYGQGLVTVTGRIVGDESAFDARRGPSGFSASPWVGVLSGLAYRPSSASVRGRPALAAARALRKELRLAGVEVRGRAVTNTTPPSAVPLLRLVSPSVAQLAAETNKPSDNFHAEQLLKSLGSTYGRRGSTAAGAQVVRRDMAGLGLRPRVVDGSGLSSANRTTPRQVVALLRAMWRRADPTGDAFMASLAVAGRDGTLVDRMRRSAARDRCTGKTGTLYAVSALAGYCTTPAGREVAYAIIVNRADVPRARRLQDRVVGALARYSG